MTTHQNPPVESEGERIEDVDVSVEMQGSFLEYAYSADYTQRRPVTSATPRVVYVGITLTR